MPYAHASGFPSPCNDRGGQAPALRLEKRLSFTVGRGPVPRHAAISRETAWVGVRFSRRSDARGGQAPALRYARPSPFHRRARACPSPCCDLEGNGLGRRAFFARVGRSRGTGPRATVREKPSLYRRAWALACHTRMREGFPRHAALARETALVGVRFSRRSDARGGQAPALRKKRAAYRRARACPSPCNARGGQAPALR